MASYVLKDGVCPFRPVTGACKGVRFIRGMVYSDVPREHAHCFTRIDVQEAAVPEAPEDEASQPEDAAAEGVSPAIRRRRKKESE